MVKFEKNKIVLEIETSFPVETWNSMQMELTDLYSAKSADESNPYNYVLQLLGEMCLNKDIVEILEKLNKKGGLNNGTL